MKSVLWRVAKCLSYIEEARCLKVNQGVFVPDNTVGVPLCDARALPCFVLMEPTAPSQTVPGSTALQPPTTARHFSLQLLCRHPPPPGYISADFLGVFAKLQKATIRFVCLSVRLPIPSSAWNSSAPTGRIFMKFDT